MLVNNNSINIDFREFIIQTYYRQLQADEVLRVSPRDIDLDRLRTYVGTNDGKKVIESILDKEILKQAIADDSNPSALDVGNERMSIVPLIRNSNNPNVFAYYNHFLEHLGLQV